MHAIEPLYVFNRDRGEKISWVLNFNAIIKNVDLNAYSSSE